jgi:hypothetical protein
LQAVFGVIPAYNLLLLASFVIGGYGAYLLGLEFLRGAKTRENKELVDKTGHPREADPASPRHRVTLSPCQSITLAAFLGGALYAFASAKLFYAALGQGNIASSQWIPFAALYLVRLARGQGGARPALLAALFTALQAYAELTYASFLLVFAAVAALWGASRLAHTPSRGVPFACRFSPFVLRFALWAALVLLALTPVLANMLPDLAAEGDFFTAGGGFTDIFSADLAGYAAPTQLHPLLGGWIQGWAADSAPRPDGRQFAVNKGQQIYIGYMALTLTLLGLWRGRRQPETWLWGTAAALFFLLTLGPSLRVAGHDLGIPLPFRIMEALPFFKGNRYPSRYSVMLLLSLAPLVAMGGRGIREWKRVNSFSCLLVPLLLFEHLSTPLPLFDLRVPALYQRVAAEPGDFALLELPLGWRNGARVAGKSDILIMQQLWYQTTHGKRLLGGNTSRNPEFKFQYFSEDPTLARLIAQTNAADLPQHEALRAMLAGQPITTAEAERARAWAAFLDIRYVMVHRDKLPVATEADLRALLPVELAAQEGSLALYRVEPAASAPLSFRLGTDGGRMALAEGWSRPDAMAGEAVYAQRRETRLLLPMGASPYRLEIEGQALAPGQRIELLLNGQPVGATALPQDRTILSFDLPADPNRPPLSQLRLRFAGLAPAATGSASVLVRSAGQETGDFGHIYLQGVEVAPNRRGYNLAAFRAEEGARLATAVFDTHVDPAASMRLAAWVAALPAGTAVAGAVRDEASLNLTGEAVAALRSLGVAGDLRGKFRWGHAFIGAVGLAPGRAQEAMDARQPVEVALGRPISSPAAAAALTAVTLLPAAQ